MIVLEKKAFDPEFSKAMPIITSEVWTFIMKATESKAAVPDEKRDKLQHVERDQSK